jgi:hypothetical protein
MAARIRCLAVGRQPGRPEWADCVKDDFWLIVAPLRSNDEKRANACLRYIFDLDSPPSVLSVMQRYMVTGIEHIFLAMITLLS